MKNCFFSLLLCFTIIDVNAQFKVTGKVLEQGSNTPLPGATVILKNSKYAVATDANGVFTFTLPDGNYTLEVSYVGFIKYTKTFFVTGNDLEFEISLYPDVYQMKELEIISTRATINSAMASSEVDSSMIAQNNLGLEFPYLLDQTPSVVVTSDGGNGIGYSGIRIRGSDPTRVNVTINGIPVNDAESQGVFWVDFPDLASSTSSVQIQRGAGTSTNGAGAFGGTVNIQTLNTNNEKASAEISNSYGSFNTHKHTLKVGSGRIYKNKNEAGAYFTFDTRLSWIASDGYIDRAFSDMKSYYISSAYVGKKSDLRFVMFSGRERTYQAWGGVPKELIDSNRTYNPYTYENETDNYIQTNYQLMYNFSLSEKIKGNVSLHYTKGAGYYEQFKEQESFSDYGINDLVLSDSTVISETDLIRQRWLDNDFYGIVYSFNYNPNEKLNILFGGGWNNYLGKHFGKVIWAEYASNSFIGHQYYMDTAQKSDINTYLKVNYWLTNKINFFTDLQVRNVNYEFLGFDRDLNYQLQNDNLLFFNPKFGLTGYLPNNQIIYSSFAIANKEPNRSDYTESSVTSRPLHETMMDIELGYKISSHLFSAGINLYHMQYKNQLVLTGKINDVGAYTRQNIADSYRRGLELEAGFKYENFSLTANATFSQNKILNYIEYIDNWDTWAQDSVIYNVTDIAFSPSVIAGGTINYQYKYNTPKHTHSNFNGVVEEIFTHEILFSFIPKYVGKQYIDNTSNEDRSLEGYFVCDTRFIFSRKSNSSGKFIAFNFTVRNFLNELYSNNAWSYTYSYGGVVDSMIGYFPQAGINYLMGLTIGF